MPAPSRPPVVVVLDHSYWQAFADLAGALSQRGVRVERITARSPSARERVFQLLERPLFRRVRHFSGERRGPGVIPVRLDDVAALVPPTAVDVLTQEDLLAACLPVTTGLLAPGRRVGAGVDPRVLVDKWLQGQTAAAAGVDVPTAWESPVSSTFPVVVKARLGFGGTGVRVVHDETALAEAWEELGEDGIEPFLQTFHAGAVNTGGVALRGEVLACAAYRPTPDPNRPTSQPFRLTVLDRPDAVDAATRYVQAIGYTGFFCIDFVIDADDRALLIDVNPRPFGSWALLQELGLDLVGAYLHSLGLGPRPEPTAAVPGASAAQLVFPCPDRDRGSDVSAWRRESLTLVSSRGRWLGRRWRVSMRAQVEMGAVRSRLALVFGLNPGAQQGRIGRQDDNAERDTP